MQSSPPPLNCRNIIAPFLWFTRKLTAKFTKKNKKHEVLFFSVPPSVPFVTSVVKPSIKILVIPANAGIQKIWMQAQRLTFWIATSLSLLAMTTGSAVAAINIPFTINLSENVTVTGTPRIAVDVGGNTRYATYTSGTGTNALIFTLSPTIGDVDLDGVTVSSPIDLNGGTIKDNAGNDVALTFTPPNTSGIKVNYPSLGMDFTNGTTGRYTLNGTVYNDLSSFLIASGGTFARNSIATYYDSTGTLQTAPANTPRFDYDPVTHAAKGILIEENRTNGIRNNIMVGAVAGTPGTAPTNWSTSTNGGISRSIISTGQENGINYVDIRFYGTSTSAVYLGVYFEGGKTYPAIAGEIHTATAYITLVGGSLTNINGPVLVIRNNDSAGTGLSQYATANCVPIMAALNSRRCSVTNLSTTFSNASTAYLAPYFQAYIASAGLAVDFTLRIGLPQIEKGPFATSAIPTTTAAATRAADTLSIPTGSWFNGNTGTQLTTQYYTSNFADYSPIIGSSQANSIGISYQGLSGNNVVGFVDGTIRGSTGILSSSGFYNMAISNTASQILVSRNGAPAVSAAGKNLSGATTLYLSKDFNNTMANAPKWIKKYKFYPSAMDNTQLQLLTQ